MQTIDKVSSSTWWKITASILSPLHLGFHQNPQHIRCSCLDICHPTEASVQCSSVQSFSHVRLFVSPWTAARQASLSITNSWSFLKLMSITSVMPSNHLILCCPLFLPPSIPPSIRVSSNESFFLIRWPKCWSFSFSISPSNEYSGWLPLGWTG